ncbi:MAG: alanine dehydrogenase [Desulfobacteraceae bacterium]|nr:alanine dehydrogenase [Desulfobacteraceae bacterium]MBC2756345.1 alanine dehydrogenase [Desulfobacteraceae bacterium]
MIIGIPKEIKSNENRVSLPPWAVGELVQNGHKVLVETNAGINSGFENVDYTSAGAQMMHSASGVWGNSEMIVKVKEPVHSEYVFFREDLILFTFLHLAADRELTDNLLEKKVTGLAYETFQLDDGSLPLLVPMSEIAGRIGAQEAACHLKKHSGGKGLLIGGSAGVPPAKVAVLGGGISGCAAARVCLGMGAHVTIFDINVSRLREIDDIFDGKCVTCYASAHNVQKSIADSDVIIGCVLIPGAKAPKLITREMLKIMSPGSVLVDIAIDQGGCFETSRPTTHENPTYIEEKIVHYCVTNMPGAVPRTSSIALANVTLPHIKKVAGSKLNELLLADNSIRSSINTYKGKLTNQAVADAFQLKHDQISSLPN